MCSVFAYFAFAFAADRATLRVATGLKFFDFCLWIFACRVTLRVTNGPAEFASKTNTANAETSLGVLPSRPQAQVCFYVKFRKKKKKFLEISWKNGEKKIYKCSLKNPRKNPTYVESQKPFRVSKIF